ncbi:MAG TPA: hypothetical protein VF551_02105, partial [Chthoniobacterales bacterium]
MPATARYSRLFRRKFAPHDEDLLHRLADTMRNPVATIIRETPAGFVYFGQFIDHDLTGDGTRLGDAGTVEPEATPNYCTPRLDL